MQFCSQIVFKSNVFSKVNMQWQFFDSVEKAFTLPKKVRYKKTSLGKWQRIRYWLCKSDYQICKNVDGYDFFVLNYLFSLWNLSAIFPISSLKTVSTKLPQSILLSPRAPQVFLCSVLFWKVLNAGKDWYCCHSCFLDDFSLFCLYMWPHTLVGNFGDIFLVKNTKEQSWR